MKKLFVIPILLFTSCVAKKEISHKLKTQEVYTNFRESNIVTSAPILASIVVDEICDSVTSKPKTIFRELIVGADTMKLSIENNILKSELKFAAKQISKRDSTTSAVRNIKDEVSSKTIVKTKPTRVTWIFLAGLIIFVIFPFIPKYIHKIFRKLIIGI